MFSSDPPSQYCIDRNQLRRSCALPGISRRIFGSRRSVFIWLWPDVLAFAWGLSFFISAIRPEAGRCMSRSPIFVSRTRSLSAIMLTIAAQRSRRARKDGRIAATCSSRNSRFVTITSPCATAACASASAAGFSPHSPAA